MGPYKAFISSSFFPESALIHVIRWSHVMPFHLNFSITKTRELSRKFLKISITHCRDPFVGKQ